MIYLLTSIPWVIVVVALLTIMFLYKKPNRSILDHDIFDDEDLLTNVGEPTTLKVAVYDDKAYWVYNNVLYESETTKEPDWDTAKPVDTMAMAQQDVDKLLKVLDELQEFDGEERE